LAGLNWHAVDAKRCIFYCCLSVEHSEEPPFSQFALQAAQ